MLGGWPGGSISYRLFDAHGTVKKELPRCKLDGFLGPYRFVFNQPGTDRAVEFLDFSQAMGHVSEAVFTDSTDATNPRKKYRYFITRLTNNEQGNCAVDNGDSLITMAGSASGMKIEVTAYDYHGIKKIYTKTF